MRSIVVALLLILLPGDVRAGDGVLEINHTCAVQTGCFAGDPPGYPVIIPSSGSYRLTGNLSVDDVVQTVIDIRAKDVSIDLAGFEIRGPVTCVNGVCTPPGNLGGSGIGVLGIHFAATGASVRNGSISGMGGMGVRLVSRAEVTNLRVSENGAGGIRVGSSSTVSGNTVSANGHQGIISDGSTTISNNAVSSNGGIGIEAAEDSTISNNTSNRNGGVGIWAPLGSTTIIENTTVGNDGHGISGGDGSTITGNTANGNGQYGIHSQQSSLIQGNTLRTNATGGISAGFLAHIVDNSLDGNGGPGIAANDGSNVSRNTVGALTPAFAGHPGITCGGGCAVYDNLVRNTSQAMTLGAGSRYGRNVLSLSPNPAITGSGVSAGDNLCNGASC